MSALVVAAVVLVLALLVSKRRLAYRLSTLPGPPALPLLGNALSLVTKDPAGILKQLHEWQRTYGGVYVYWVGLDPIVVVTNPENLQRICSYGKDTYKSSDYRFIEPYIGRGILLTTGEEWSARRRLLTPAFNQEVLERMVEVACKHGKVLADHLECGKSFNLVPLASRTALEAVTESLLGVRLNTIEEPNNPLLTTLHRASDMIMERAFSAFYRVDFLYRFSSLKKEEDKCASIIRKCSIEAISKREELRKAQLERHDANGIQTDVRGNLIDVLLDLRENNGVYADDDAVLNEIRTFLFAGYDTTATALSFTLYCLGRNAHIQERVVEEMRGELAGFPEEAPTLRQLARLELLDRVVKESLRMFPPVPLTATKISQPVLLGGTMVPPGVDLYVNVFSLHRDDSLYPEPDVFDPDRFLPQEVAERSTYAYMPFSAGSRNCIGQKLAMLVVKVAVLYVLDKFSLQSVQEEKDLRLGLRINLCPVDGIDILLKPRS